MPVVPVTSGSMGVGQGRIVPIGGMALPVGGSIVPSTSPPEPEAPPLPPIQSALQFGVDLVKSTLEGAVAPLTAPAHLAMGELSQDPAIRKEELSKAGKDAIKGLGFYGGMLVAGPAGGAVVPLAENLAVKGIMGKVLGSMIQAGAEGAAFAGTNEAITGLPDLADHKTGTDEYIAHVGTAAAFGGMTGIAFPALGAGLKASGKGSYELTRKVANKILDTMPNGPAVRQATTEFTSLIAKQWQRMGTGGDQVLHQLGLGDVVEKLKEARKMILLTGGGYNSQFKNLVHGLSSDERKTIAGMLEGISFTRSEFGASTQAAYGPLFEKARAVHGLLRELGEDLQAAGQTVLEDPGTYRTFTLIDRYLPRRYVNPDAYREGGEYRELAIKRVLDAKPEMQRDPVKAGEWLDDFAGRIEGEINGILNPTGGGSGMGANHYFQARTMNLPGYETDVEKLLPQYFESASKRLILLNRFGSTRGQIEEAPFANPQPLPELTREWMGQRQIGSAKFPQQRIWAYRLRGTGEVVHEPMLGTTFDPNQIAGVTQKNVRDVGIIVNGKYKKLFRWENKAELAARGGTSPQLTTYPRRSGVATSPEQNALFLRTAAVRQAQRDAAIYARYPRAFDALNRIEDPDQRALAKTLIRRQLGAIEQPANWAQSLFSKVAMMEVITKLAHGAIAQPTQMLSGAVRTDLRSGIVGFTRAMANLPEAYDFALRAGVIMRGVVRHSEESLTGQLGTDFLEHVYFTQADLLSRVVGAHQGAAYAEFMAKELTRMLRAREAGERVWLGGAFRRARPIDKAIAGIEAKFKDLGIDAAALAERGGTLTDDEILSAAQKVATDVNFWGDQLSLPELFKSPYGRFLTMFKSFGFQQSRLMKDYVVKPALKGDLSPIIRLAVTMPLAGEIVTDLKKLARGKTRQEATLYERALTNISNAAGFGLAYDAYTAGGYGIGGIFGMGLGPVYSEPAKLAEASYNASQGDPQKLYKWLLETGVPGAVTPVVAPGLTPIVATLAPRVSNTLFPPRTP